MEGSKTFAKDFMTRHNIPTAGYQNFNNYEEARKYLDDVGHKVVLKATGLAGGKGVLLPASKNEAVAALEEIMLKKAFGSAGNEVVIEEYLEGQELSVLSFSDGYTIRSLPAAQDHKQISCGDTGPNTGGMGCYAPAPIATPQLVAEIHRTALQPTIDGMRKEKMPFVGLLFTGFMVTKNGPRCLEYNVRFGDPESQTLLPLMDGDLAEVMIACTDGHLDSVAIGNYPLFATTVVAAAEGYPGNYVRGEPITFEEPPRNTLIFHAGTKAKAPTDAAESKQRSLQLLHAAQNHASTNGSDGHPQALTTSGGRVIAATASASTLQDAVTLAYQAMSTIRFNGMYFRKDIAQKGLRYASYEKTRTSQEGLTYASAGVSIADGNSLVERIKGYVKSTARTGALAEIGGFGGTFQLDEAGYTAAPILVGAVDGVGTKLHIALEMGKHDTIGIDCVAMNTNDLVVQGAEALFFLDVYTCSKLDVNVAEKVIQGVARGCAISGCALIGGETAEMKGLLRDERAYDIVGAAIGAIEQGKKILPLKADMCTGDVVLGLASSGVHSNGFSLIRLIVENAGLSYSDKAPWGDGETVGESLLIPTRIYVKAVLEAVKKDLIKGAAHITGGGLLENIPRMLPDHLAADINASAWPIPRVFRWLKAQGKVDPMEFCRTFNTGLGMVLVIGETKVEEAVNVLRAAGDKVYVVGKLVKRGGEGCIVNDVSSWD